MSILPQELIENSIAKDVNQLFKMNPTTQEAGNNTIIGDVQTVGIRGFNIGNPIINGIPYSSNYVSTPMTQDIERLEVINGATGFLYGGGRVGGAVNYVTKKSTFDNLRDVSVGSYGSESYFAHLDLGGQFDQNNIFGYRINAVYQDGELPSTRAIEQKAISVLLDWKPIDNFYTDFKYAYKDALTKGANPYFINIDDRSSIKSNKVSNPDWMQHHIKSDRFENTIRWDINEIFILRTALSYEEMNVKTASVNLNYTDNKVNISSAGGFLLGKSAWRETKNQGVHIFLDSKFDTAKIDHTLTIGYSLNSSKQYGPSDGYGYWDKINNPIYLTLAEFRNLAEPNVWYNWAGTSEVTVGTQPSVLTNKTEYKNILIGDDIKFNDQWSALLGFNYATIASWSSWSGGYEDSALTPTLSLIYKPIDRLTTYATYIESLEAGTIVSDTYLNENEILEPYKSTQYELGAKFSLNDRALISAALFRIEKANSYDDESTTATQGKPTLTQDGKQIHQGLELTLTGKVTDHLTLITGGTWMDLRLDKVDDLTLKGKKPANAAAKMAKIFAEYQVPDIEGLSLSAGAYYTGKKYGDSANTDILPAYTLFDAGIRYSTTLGNYPTTFNLTAQNITDKVYWVFNDQLGDPRTLAFSVKTQF